MFRALLLFIFILTACALPKKGGLPDSFISKSEQSAIAFVNQGNELFNKGRYQDAERYYQQALQLFPEADNIKVNLANTLIRNGLEVEAKVIAEDLIRRSPDNKNYLLLSALIDYYTKNYQLAAQKYENIIDNQKIILTNDEQNQLYNNLSTVYFMLGEDQKAFCLADFAYRIRKDADNKNRLARLTLALMPGREGVLGKQSDGTIGRSDNEFFLYSSLFFFAQGDYVKALETAAELESLSRSKDSFVEQAGIVALLAKYKLNQISADELEELQADIDTYFVNNLLKDNVRLYWPIEVIVEFRNLRRDISD